MTFSFAKRIAVSLLGLALMIQPVFGQNVSHSSTSVSTSRDSRDTKRWRTSNGFDNFNVEYRGRIEITDDDKDIKSMSDDGYLEISKTVFGSRRSIIIEAQGNGKIKKEYYEGRTLTPWEPNGKAWLSEILPEVVRTTTLCAESRVNRFFKQGGTTAVLNEISKSESDYMRAEYANLLMKQPIQAKDYAVIINTLANKIDSDHYMTEFLRSNTDKFLQNKEATTALFSATRRMDSDHYKTIVIKEALQGQMASLENVKIILQAASQMDSDHYITEVLNSLLRQDNLTDEMIAEMITTTKSMDSDHYKTVILSGALRKPGLSATSLQRVVETVKSMDSDHYITVVVKDLLKNKLTDDLLATLLNISTSMDSDHYRTEVFSELFRQMTLSESQFSKVVDAIATMDSDHYKSSALQQAVASNSISEANVIKVIAMTKGMDSDHYITQVLIQIAPKVKTGSSSLKDAYRAAARNISSETYYGRALRAIE